jgi:uncharacterized protein (TIGR02598 family)
MNRNRQVRSAFTLVEVSLSLALAGFTLIALFGLLPLGFNNNQASIHQTIAANIMTAIAADLQTAATTATASQRFGISLQNPSTYYLDESGGPFPASNAPVAASRYRITTTVTPPPSGQRIATMVGVVVSWPAVVAPANAAGQVATFVGLDRN